MTDRQLEAFIKAAECGSFTKAAALLFITPSALMQQVNLLEKEAGFPLFYRTSHGVKLTPGGARLYETAREILVKYREARSYGRELLKKEEYHIRYARGDEGLPAFIWKPYRAFQADHPYSLLEFPYFTSDTHFDDIREGKADITTVAEPKPCALEGLSYIPLLEDTFTFLMASDNPLSSRAIIRREDLSGKTILAGKYASMAHPFEDMLPKEAKVVLLNKAYDMKSRMQSLFSDDLTIIHSAWAHNFSGCLKAVPSDIPAGGVGLLCRKEASRGVLELIQYVKKAVSR